MSDKRSEIIVKTTMSEFFILDDIDVREISICKSGLTKRLFLKFDGMNNKTEQKDQIQIYLGKNDAQTICEGINNCIKNGLFEEEKFD